MHLGQTVFAQLMDCIPAHDFRRCVDRYRGNYKVSSFSCWDQFLCMAFAQLTYRESLRDIETCLRALGAASSIMRAFAVRCPAAPWPMPTSCATGASTPTWRKC